MRDPQKVLREAIRYEGRVLRGLSRSAIVTLVLCIGLAIVAIYVATTVDADIPMSSSGYLAMAFGVIVTLLVGMGLMALIFFSNRRGYDRPPDFQSRNDDRSHSRH